MLDRDVGGFAAPRRDNGSTGALYALTLAMAADRIAEGIRVNGVAPGTADTPWIARLLATSSDPEAERTALKARQPMRRLVSADEVAYAIAYLASPRWASTTGRCWPSTAACWVSACHHPVMV